MSEFINTIDVLGDDAVVDSIINRTITEFKDDQITSVGQYAFYNCKALTTVDLPAVTSLGQYAFYGCSSLESIILPELTDMGYSAYASFQFANCTSLETIILPKIDKVGFNSNTFSECKAIKYADFGIATIIAGNLFHIYCPIRTLILRNTDQVATLGGATKAFENAGTNIYVPRALLSDDDATKDYRRATNWSAYASQFRALEDYTVDGTITGELDETKI